MSAMKPVFGPYFLSTAKRSPLWGEVLLLYPGQKKNLEEHLLKIRAVLLDKEAAIHDYRGDAKDLQRVRQEGRDSGIAEDDLDKLQLIVSGILFPDKTVVAVPRTRPANPK